MIRTAALAFALTFVSGAATADGFAWPSFGATTAVISSDPWDRLGPTSTLDADDAYVFADVSLHAHLDPDATALALQTDRDRMAHDLEGEAFTGPSSDPRIGTAFGGFVAIGPQGLAYASLGLARGDGAASARLAAAAALPQPSLVATLLAAR